MGDTSKFTFIYADDDCWYLVLRTVEDLQAYWKEFDSYMQKMAAGVAETKEFGKGWNHCNAYQLLIGTKAKHMFCSHEEAAKEICIEVHVPQYQAIQNGDIVYVNRKFGWNSSKKEHKQFIHKSVFEFPKKEKDLLKIEKFPLGNHYYVYVDGVQLKDGDKVKWNTYSEAEEFANKYLGINKKES